VPYSDFCPIVVPEHLDDDRVLFLSDILPTGWMAAENADIEPGDTVAVWGCDPVGLFAIQSALIQGAERVIAIDHFPARLELAKKLGAEIIHYHQADARDALDEMTGGIGPDAVIDCVGMESHGLTADNIADQLKSELYLVSGRPHALRQAILACRKGGRVSIPGVYGGFADKFPLGQLMEKGLTVKSGQTHVQKYTRKLLEMIEQGKIDTTFLISHQASLEDGPEMYGHWHDEQNDYTKIVLKTALAKGNIKAVGSAAERAGTEEMAPA
jgi:threonine dehydrogenase-like Zn-dependent dehydrogenase